MFLLLVSSSGEADCHVLDMFRKVWFSSTASNTPDAVWMFIGKSAATTPFHTGSTPDHRGLYHLYIQRFGISPSDLILRPFPVFSF